MFNLVVHQRFGHRCSYNILFAAILVHRIECADPKLLTWLCRQQLSQGFPLPFKSPVAKVAAFEHPEVDWIGA